MSNKSKVVSPGGPADLPPEILKLMGMETDDLLVLYGQSQNDFVIARDKMNMVNQELNRRANVRALSKEKALQDQLSGKQRGNNKDNPLQGLTADSSNRAGAKQVQSIEASNAARKATAKRKGK